MSFPIRSILTKVGNYARFGLSTSKLYPVGRIHTSVTNLAAEVAKPAPDFKGTAVVNGQFKEIKLSDYKGKYVVLFFYPLDFTFVCPTEIIAFSEAASEFKALNTEVIAASTDSHFSHLAWINTPRKKGGLGSLNIPVLSDYTKSIAKEYGILMESGIALRGLFLIDPKGVLRQITVNDLPVGRSVTETIRLVKAFQFVEKHGEVQTVEKKMIDSIQSIEKKLNDSMQPSEKKMNYSIQSTEKKMNDSVLSTEKKMKDSFQSTEKILKEEVSTMTKRIKKNMNDGSLDPLKLW